MNPLDGPAIRKLGEYLARQPGGDRLIWEAARKLGLVKGEFPSDREEHEPDLEEGEEENGEDQ